MAFLQVGAGNLGGRTVKLVRRETQASRGLIWARPQASAVALRLDFCTQKAGTSCPIRGPGPSVTLSCCEVVGKEVGWTVDLPRPLSSRALRLTEDYCITPRKAQR